jgi:hypothetical protein
MTRVGSQEKKKLFLIRALSCSKNSVGCFSVAWLSLVDVFAKLRKAAVSFVRYVRPPVRMEELGSHWTDFHEILYLNIC